MTGERSRAGGKPAEAARAWGWPAHGAASAALAALAAGLVWSTGFRGFMPLDQSIVWDGAWRLLSGQAPFADFLMPNGLVPAAIQAGIFHVFGLSWTAYVAHAALANAAFALMTYATLARLFGRPGPAALYAAATAAMFYPPMGTPYMDQHAVLFTALLLLIPLWDAMLRRPSAPLWFLLPIVAALAFLSKQAPSAWAMPWVVFMLAVPVRRWNRGMGGALAALVSGAVAVAVGFILILAALGATLGEAWLSLIDLPGEIGRRRLDWAWIAPRLGDLAKPGLLVVVAALAWRAAALLRPSGQCDAPLAWVTHASATGIVLVSSLYVLLTDNSAWFGLGALPLAAGLAHVRVERRLAATGRFWRHAGWIVAVAIALQAAVQFVDTSFARAANELRRADWAKAAPGETVDPRLAGLIWALPPASPGETNAEAYAQLLRYVRAQLGGFVLIGDAAILYALADKPSAFSALWLHPGLTYPPPGHGARADFDALVARALRRHDVRSIVIDGERSWAGARAGDFAPIAACLARAQGTTAIGRFRVVAVPPGCGQG